MITCLAGRLKTTRESLGYDQKIMAEKLGISFRSWQDYELGKSVPGGKVFESLVKLGVNANWLLMGKGGMREGTSYAMPEIIKNAGVVNNKPVAFDALPVINQRILQLPQLLDLDEEGFCRQLEIEADVLELLRAGQPVSGLLIRAVAYEWDVRMRWLKLGELPVRLNQLTQAEYDRILALTPEEAERERLEEIDRYRRELAAPQSA